MSARLEPARWLDRERTPYGDVGRSRPLDDGLTRTRVARDLEARVGAAHAHAHTARARANVFSSHVPRSGARAPYLRFDAVVEINRAGYRAQRRLPFSAGDLIATAINFSPIEFSRSAQRVPLAIARAVICRVVMLNALNVSIIKAGDVTKRTYERRTDVSRGTSLDLILLFRYSAYCFCASDNKLARRYGNGSLSVAFARSFMEEVSFLRKVGRHESTVLV